MADYTELKSLARALPAKAWHAAHANAGARGWEVCQGVDQVAADLTGPRAKFIAAANPAAVLELITENEMLREGRTMLVELRETHGFDSWSAALVKVDRLQAEVEALRNALVSAAEEVESWGSYASEYFQQKHDLPGSVARIRSAAATKESSQ